MIYKVDDGYVISSHGAWLPGFYESEPAARYAFQFRDESLVRLQEEVAPGPITMEMLKEERRRLSNSEAFGG